jgi:hypothetical protein
MLHRHAAALLAASLGMTLVAAAAPRMAQSPGQRIVAVGDIHGSLEGLTEILKAAELIDASGQWSGGSAHLVQTGDYLDRGDKVRDVLEMLMRLEDEARRAGGRAEVLLGNHEVMNLVNDLRDVSPNAFAAFADDRSAQRQERAYRDYEKLMKRTDRTAIPVEQWTTAHPPGFVEYVEALEPRGRYGKWLRERKVVVEDGGTIFMHAGLSEDTTGSLEDVNKRVHGDLEDWDRARDMLQRAELILPVFTLPETLDAIGAELKRIATALESKQPVGEHVTREFVEALQAVGRIGKSSLLREDGPLWFRGFAEWPDDDPAKVEALLQRFKAVRFVTGHTPIVKGITSRFDHRIFLIDTGMLSSRYPGGRASALEIVGDTVTAIYANGREVLAQPAVKD